MSETVELGKLWNDGDTIELEDGRVLRYKTEPDYIDPFEEFDSYGKVASADGSRANHRPDGFDGNAEKLWLSRDAIWWQPPEDVKRTDEGFDTLRQVVRDLAEYGLVSVGLELLEGSDYYGNGTVIDAEWLGGVEAIMDDAYRKTILSEQYEELRARHQDLPPQA